LVVVTHYLNKVQWAKCWYIQSTVCVWPFDASRQSQAICIRNHCHLPTNCPTPATRQLHSIKLQNNLVGFCMMCCCQRLLIRIWWIILKIPMMLKYHGWGGGKWSDQRWRFR
jgi:hypothetical protein